MKNTHKKIITVYGTRPEAIKLAPVILSLQRSTDFQSYTCVTAQHREMLDQINQMFDIKPDFDLDIMKTNQSLDQLSANIFTKLTPVLEKVKPDWVLVQGDTTTAMITSLAAYYQKIKVAHVEAGLRTDDKWEPFPEEINRRLISVTADLHFAPTAQAQQNLVDEGISREKIILTGNTIIDALHLISSKEFKTEYSVLADVPWNKQIVLVTVHRRENFGQPLNNICDAINILTENHQNTHFVFPVHKNPQIESTVYSELGKNPKVTLLPPLDYHAFIYLMKHCIFVMTDSGGIQEEAPTLGKPLLVLRDSTERPESIDLGFVKLIGTELNRIVEEGNFLLKNPHQLKPIPTVKNPYGDGKAAQRIIKALKNYI